jgi:hypothetical protein
MRKLLLRRPTQPVAYTRPLAVAAPARDARFSYVPGLGSQPGDVDQRGFIRVITSADDMGVWVAQDTLRGAGWNR